MSTRLTASFPGQPG